MSEFISLVTDVLSIELNLGSTSITLGGIVLGYTLLKAGLYFAKRIADYDPIDAYIDDANREIERHQREDTERDWAMLVELDDYRHD